MSHPVLANFLTAKEKYHKKVHMKKIVDKGHRLMSAFQLLAPFLATLSLYSLVKRPILIGR